MLVCATACGADAPPAVEKTPDAVVAQDDFEIISTKYTYKENNVSVVQVKNKSTQAYTVTLNGEYLNADGKVLKKESKTFEGFAGEWKNYFIFNPGIAYDKLNITIEKTEYTKTAWAGGVLWITPARIRVTVLYKAMQTVRVMCILRPRMTT